MRMIFTLFLPTIFSPPEVKEKGVDLSLHSLSFILVDMIFGVFSFFIFFALSNDAATLESVRKLLERNK